MGIGCHFGKWQIYISSAVSTRNNNDDDDGNNDDNMMFPLNGSKPTNPN